MKRNTIIYLIICLVVLAAGGVTTYFLCRPDNSFIVLFSDAKKITAGDAVYLTGIQVGKVKSVAPQDGKVAISINVTPKYRDQMTRNTTFFINTDHKKNGGKCVLARVLSPGGEPIKAGETVKGISSTLVWKSLEVADSIDDVFESEPVQRMIQEAKKKVAVFEKHLKKIDWERLGKNIQKEVENVIEEINEALQSEAAQESMLEIEKKINRLKKTLQRVGESNEARQLETALENLYQKLGDELKRDE